MQRIAKRTARYFPMFSKQVIHYMNTDVDVRAARARGLEVKCYDNYLDIIQSKKKIRISKQHKIYMNDILDEFDYYFNSVCPIISDGFHMADFSTPKYHDVIGYSQFPIFIPSLPEPIRTTCQYLEFAQLNKNDTVFDLGAYSGLSSIIFKNTVGSGGTVIAVEVDEVNLFALRKNIENYQKASGHKVEILNAAIWNHDQGIEFSIEGNMGSSATDIIGKKRGLVKKVPSVTLSSIVQKFSLSRVDFIKCDIEGAEYIIFEDAKFFKKFKPKMIIEEHPVKGMTIDKLINNLKKYGYQCKIIDQEGSSYKLIECYP